MEQNPKNTNNNRNSPQNYRAVDDLLSTYRDQYISTSNSDASSSSEAWKVIHKHIHSTTSNGSTHQAKRFVLYSRYQSIFKYAAVLLVMVLGWWYTSSTDIFKPQEQLVAYSEDQITRIELPDGSIVQLRPYSELYEISSSSESAHYRLEGEAFFNVTKQSTGTFKVNAGLAQVEVLGTRFNLSSYALKTQLYLEEGSIALHPLGTSDTPLKETIQVEPTQSVILSKSELQLKESQSADSFIDWLENTMVVDNKNFDELLDELEQHYNITLSYPSGLSTEKISGRLKLSDQSTTLSDFSLLFNGNFIEKSTDSYMFVPID